MNNNFVRCVAALSFAASNFVFSTNATAQTSFENAMEKKLNSLVNVPDILPKAQLLSPNDAPSGMMSPTGFGGSGTYLFGGIGGTYPELYRKKQGDFVAFGGISAGNPVKAVNVAVGVNMTDVNKFTNFSANLTVSRQLSAASSISVGTIGLFASSVISDSPGSTFYLAFSHAVQWAPSKTPGASALSYTIGVGTGRFLYKSPLDVQKGKGVYATAVFAGVSYEVFRHMNVAAEWYSTNLGVSVGVRPFTNPLSIGFGVDNLTSYSGDRASMILTIGYPLNIRRAASN